MATESPSNDDFLRPLAFCELLQRIFVVYRRRELIFLGVSLLCHIPYLLVALVSNLVIHNDYDQVLNGQEDYQVFYVRMVLLLTLQCIVLIFAATVARGVLARAVCYIYVGKENFKLASVFHASIDSFGTLICACLVLFAGSTFVVGAAVGGIFLDDAPDFQKGTLFFFGILIVIIFYLVVLKFALVAPVVVVEKAGVFASFFRSWKLTDQSYCFLLGTSFVFSFVIVFIRTFCAAVTRSPTVLESPVWAALASGLAPWLICPLHAIFETVLYFHYRTSTEALTKGVLESDLGLVDVMDEQYHAVNDISGRIV